MSDQKSIAKHQVTRNVALVRLSTFRQQKKRLDADKILLPGATKTSNILLVLRCVSCGITMYLQFLVATATVKPDLPLC